MSPQECINLIDNVVTSMGNQIPIDQRGVVRNALDSVRAALPEEIEATEAEE